MGRTLNICWKMIKVKHQFLNWKMEIIIPPPNVMSCTESGSGQVLCILRPVQCKGNGRNGCRWYVWSTENVLSVTFSFLSSVDLGLLLQSADPGTTL